MLRLIYAYLISLFHISQFIYLSLFGLTEPIVYIYCRQYYIETKETYMLHKLFKEA